MNVLCVKECTTLYKSDYKLLDNKWLNDNLINFEMEFIRETLPEDTMIVDAIQFLLIQFDNNLSLLEDLELKKYKHLLFVMNDVQDNTIPNGGTHWTMLYYNADDKIFRFYDSVINHDFSYVKHFVHKIHAYFDARLLNINN